MTELSTLLPRVTPFVNECPSGVQHDALRRAGSVFARESGAWREDHTVPSVANQAAYNFADVHGHEHVFVLRIKRVWYATRPLPDNCGIWEVADGVVRFGAGYVPVVADKDIKARLVLCGTRECTEMDDTVMTRWGDAIADLALFFIRSEEGRPYTNASGATLAWTRYQSALLEAKMAMEDAGQRSGNVMNPMPDYF